MILNITNTPRIQNRLSFGSNRPKQIVDIVDGIFTNLSASRNHSNLGLLLGKTGETNYVIEEKIFGKKAKISFQNEIGFQEVEIVRNIGEPIEITPISGNLTKENARDLIGKNLGKLNYKA